MKAKAFFFTLVVTIVFLFSHLPANAQTIHAIIVADTNDPKIGNGVKSDLSNMVTFLQNAANATGMRLNLRRIYGADCNNANTVRAVNDLQSQAEDLVVFYYSGHGHRWDATSGRWPLLSLNKELPFSWVIQKMEAKGAKGSLIITDSCNVSLGGGFGLTGPEIPPASRSTYMKLLRDFRGKVRVSGSSVGEYSYGPDSGGIFTSALLNTLSANPASWNDALERTKARVIAATRNFQIVQRPQFEVETAPTEATNGAEAISNTTYYKIVARHSGKVLDVECPTGNCPQNEIKVQQYEYLGGRNQQWMLIPVEDGYYKIVARHSGKVLDVYCPTGNCTQNEAKVQQYEYRGGRNQQWALVSVGNGYYKIVARHSGKVLDVYCPTGNCTQNGTKIQQYEYRGGHNQQWQLVPVN